MKTLNEIVTSDPRAGERACEMILKAMDICLCPAIERVYPVGGGPSYCGICGTFTVKREKPMRLLRSLDAWVPLWERMEHQYKLKHAMYLHQAIPGNLCPWEAQPHHHLEAALRTLEMECPDCGGDYKSHNPAYPDCTCTDGKRTLYDILEREAR